MQTRRGTARNHVSSQICVDPVGPEHNHIVVWCNMVQHGLGPVGACQALAVSSRWFRVEAQVFQSKARKPTSSKLLRLHFDPDEFGSLHPPLGYLGHHVTS